MLKKTIQYVNYNGQKRTKELYFNMNKYELTQMMVGEDNVSFQEYLQGMIDARDASEMIRFVKDILLMSYGEKSADGERFVKNDTLRSEFEDSAAFSELYIELLNDADKALDFVWGIMPPDMRPSPEEMERFHQENASQVVDGQADVPNLTIVSTDVTD